jgi:integrase
MSRRNAKKYEGRVYLGRDEEGKQRFHYVGTFARKGDRDRAVAAARVKLEQKTFAGRIPDCDEYVDHYLREYQRRNKDSSYDVAVERLRRFKADFAGRSLDLPRQEIKDWMNAEGRWEGRKPIPVDARPAIVALYNYAIDEDDVPLPKSPARKLGGHRSKGRSEAPPPTDDEFSRLLDACAALGEYEQQMRSLMLFAAFSLMRPGELFALTWDNVDFDSRRIRKAWRYYRGKRGTPKTGPVTIPLTPPARDALSLLPRDGDHVFTSIEGKKLSAPVLSWYWSRVRARAGLDFAFYHATKHYGVHYMWTKLGMSPRAIAAQAGWKISTVNAMLEIYGHGDVGALEEVDRAFAFAESPSPYPDEVGER